MAFEIGNVFQPAKIGAATTFGGLATDLITVLTSIAGALTLIFIILGGIKFITAGGDEKKMESAKNTITYAIIGIIITVLAFVILQIVQFFFGSTVKVT